MHSLPEFLSLSLPIYNAGPFAEPLFFLYLGPQTVLPVASIIAALVGVILMFWRLILRFIKKLINSVRRKPGLKPENNPEPAVQSANLKDEIRN